MGAERRYFQRKVIEPIPIQGLISIHDCNPIADGGYLVEASPSGFRIEIQREELCDPVLRENLSLSDMEGLEVSIFIPLMDLDVTGIITRSRYLGDSNFEVGIDYTSDAPEYWRQCLHDLLPAPNELDEELPSTPSLTLVKKKKAKGRAKKKGTKSSSAPR